MLDRLLFKLFLFFKVLFECEGSDGVLTGISLRCMTDVLDKFYYFTLSVVYLYDKLLLHFLACSLEPLMTLLMTEVECREGAIMACD